MLPVAAVTREVKEEEAGGLSCLNAHHDHLIFLVAFSLYHVSSHLQLSYDQSSNRYFMAVLYWFDAARHLIFLYLFFFNDAYRHKIKP